jgi:hypothetical protein
MENIKYDIGNLLSQVSVITKKYDEIAEITGESFNIFKILKMHANEVRTHSAFLAELLNPKGSHGQSDTFLKLFIEEVSESSFDEMKPNISIKYDKKFSDIENYSTTKAVAIVEHWLGNLNEEKTKGGRIDILITSNSTNIIIENKIYARDQDNQLIRYHNFSKNSPIYYLTLYGTKPKLTSIKNEDLELIEGTHFKCISYETEIVRWLEKCREKAVNHTFLRETLTQYINLIKFLTGQTLNKKMISEIFDVCKDKPHLIQSYLSLPSKRELKIELIRQFGEKLMKGLNRQGDYIKRVDTRFYDDSPNFVSIDFQVENWRDNIWLQIMYDFYGDEAQDPTIGVHIHNVSNEDKLKESKRLRDEIKPLVANLNIGEILDSDKDYSNWIMLHRFDRINIDDVKIWGDLYSEFGEITEKTMLEIINRVKNIEL